jgi:hypothetical protein
MMGESLAPAANPAVVLKLGRHDQHHHGDTAEPRVRVCAARATHSIPRARACSSRVRRGPGVGNETRARAVSPSGAARVKSRRGCVSDGEPEAVFFVSFDREGEQIEVDESYPHRL